jgi:acetolactate synthase-1/2/3 large subunit
MKKKISDIVVNFMVKKGLTQVFAVAGGGAMHLNDSFAKNDKINITYMHHEQACAMAADAYFREKNKPAIIHITSGPGSTNTLTGVVGAWIDSIPTFIISGQVQTHQQINKTKTRQIGVQEADIIKIIKSSTKYSCSIKNSSKIFEELGVAFVKMLEGRPGPVWIDIPLDVQAKKIVIKKYKEKTKIKKNYDINISNKIKKFIDLINKSKKPVIVVGNAIHISKSKKELYKFINRVKCPIISSWNATDLFDTNNKQYLGSMGIFGDRASNLAAQNSDLMIVLGSRLSVPQVGYNTKNFAKNSKKIIIDIDKNELNKKILSNIKLKINCDLNFFLKKINHIISKKNYFFTFTEWKRLTINWKNKYPVYNQNQLKYDKHINSFFFIKKLSKILKINSTVVTDMGTSFTCTMQTMKINNHLKQRLYTSSGLSSMGFGLPGSIGASFANPKKTIICISGDGGFMFNMQELQTIKHYNLPIKIFVLENKGYLTMQLMQKGHFKKLTGSDPSSGISIPKIKKIAKGFGLDYLKLNTKNIEDQLKKVLSNKKAMLIEVNMPKFQPLIPRIQSKLLKNGSFSDPDFDDLFPYLPKKEIEQERMRAKFK